MSLDYFVEEEGILASENTGEAPASPLPVVNAEENKSVSKPKPFTQIKYNGSAVPSYNSNNLGKSKNRGKNVPWNHYVVQRR